MAKRPRFVDPYAQGDDDASLSRREFIERTAYAAGLAGVTTLPTARLIAEAANTDYSSSRKLPKPEDLPIDTFVVLMMENRSYDHYFGWASKWSDAVQHQKYKDPESGKKVKTFPASDLGANMWQGCGFEDPGHDWDQGRAELKHGFLAKDSGNDEYALCFYNEGEVEFIQAAAQAYTTFDRYHCSLLAGTYPNRYYMWSAQSGGVMDNSLPAGGLGRQWETLFDRAQKYNPTNTSGGGGPTYHYYNSDLPFSALFGARGIGWTQPITNFYAACAGGTLPNISFVDPPFKDGSGGDGLSGDEHPHGDIRIGQSFMSDVAHAFMDSPQYERGALFIVYDEWGGFFDHVKPPSVPDDRGSKHLNDDFGQMGFRTPTVIVSPWTKRGSREQPRVSHKLFGHESIIKLITYRFGLGDLVLRDARANNIGEAFNFEKTDLDPADLPDVPMPAAIPCSAQSNVSAKGHGDEEHQRDLEKWEEYASDLGYEIGDPADAFRDSDRAREVLSGRAKPEDQDKGGKHGDDDDDDGTSTTGTTPEQTTTPTATTPTSTTTTP